MPQQNIYFILTLSNLPQNITNIIIQGNGADDSYPINCNTEIIDIDQDGVLDANDNCLYLPGVAQLSGCPDVCKQGSVIIPSINKRYNYELFCNGSYTINNEGIEMFDNVANLTPTPNSVWNLATGDWMVLDNGVGILQNWKITTAIANVYGGIGGSAEVLRENIGPGNTSEDWLVMPLQNILQNSQLRFFSRSQAIGNQGTKYEIRISNANATSQNDMSNYTTIKSYTEDDITGISHIYEEKKIMLSAFQGNRYIAFVRVNTQNNPDGTPSNSTTGDKWLLDNIRIVEECKQPLVGNISFTTAHSSTLSWNNTSNAVNFEVEYGLSGFVRGTGAIINVNTNSCIITGLLAETGYQYYVMAICACLSNTSDVMGPFNFNTKPEIPSTDRLIPSQNPLTNNCVFNPNKIGYLKFNTFQNNPTNPIFLTHFQNGQITDLCPTKYSTTFNEEARIWIADTFNSFFDTNSNLTIEQLPHYNNQYCLTDGYKIKFDSFSDITTFESNLLKIDPSNPSQITESFTNNYFKKQLISSTVQFIPIYINGNQLINTNNPSGNFNLIEFPNDFITAFQQIFPNATITITPSINSNFDHTVSVSICNLSNILYDIRLGDHTLRKTENSSDLINTNSEIKNLNVENPIKTTLQENESLKNKTFSRINYNSSNCTSTSSNLCLLYGTKLTRSNPSANNTIPSENPLENSSCVLENNQLTVKKGDRIYFRLHSIASGNPPVNWNPKVSYTDVNLSNITDSNELNPFNSSYSDGFVLSNQLPVAFPGESGSASISWDPFTIHPSDSVRFQIIKQTVVDSDGVGDQAPNIESEEIIYDQEFNPNVGSNVLPTSNLNAIQILGNSDPGIENLRKTFFYFKVISTSNVDWKNMQWYPKMLCTFDTEPIIGENGNVEGDLTASQTMYPVPDYSLYRQYPCGPAYSTFDVSNIANGNELKIKPNLNGIFSQSDSGKINFVVKSGNSFVGSRILTISNGNITSNNNNPILLGNSNASPIEISYTIDDSLLSLSTPSLLNKIAMSTSVLAKIIDSSNNTFNVPNQNINLYQKVNPNSGYFYRHWGQFMYRPTNVVGATGTSIAGIDLIKEDVLYTSLNEADATSLNDQFDTLDDNFTFEQLTQLQSGNFNLLNSIVYLPANASREKINTVFIDRWIGNHTENYASEFAFRAATMDYFSNLLEENDPSLEQDVLKTGAFAISKYSDGNCNNFSGGAGFGSVGINGSKTINNHGNNNSLTDYVDYNGDRYPDIIATSNIQYTNKTGGLENSTGGRGHVGHSTSKTIGFGASGSFSKGGDDNKVPDFHRFEGFRGNSGAGLTGNFTNGNSKSTKSWMDINGDGLTDLIDVYDTNATVSLNTGYALDTAYTIMNFPIFNSTSNAISGGIGVNKWKGSFEAGLSLSSSWNRTDNTLIDINGDGLIDIVNASDQLSVQLNTGNKYIDLGTWSSEYDLKKESTSKSASINTGFTFAFLWPLLVVTIKFPAINLNGTPYSTSTNKTLKSITDFDGDGFPDLVEEISRNNVRINYSRIRRTDKLKSVTNPLGGAFTIDYKVQPIDYNNPNAKWAMSSVEINDKCDKVNDGDDKYYKTFAYENGKYDRRERAFYGYETVKTSDGLKTSVSKYHNDSYFLNGLLKESYVLQGNDETKKYARTENTYSIKKLNDTNNGLGNPTQSLPNTFDVGGSEGRRSAAVFLTKTTNYLYELADAPLLTSEVTMTYDTKGRVINYTNNGNITDATDNYYSEIRYHEDSNLVAKNIISVPKTIEVFAGGNSVRYRDTDVNTATGAITKIRLHNNLVAGSRNDPNDISEIDLEYYANGNLNKIIYPKNESQQRMSYTYEYDPAYYAKFVTKITDTFGYSSSAKYDPKFDKILLTTDKSNNSISYEYDSFGRNIKILAPKESLIGTRDAYTLQFQYYPKRADLPPNNGTAPATFVPVAVSQHFDEQHPLNPIETYTFVDGLARPIQIKKDILINKGTTQSPSYTESLSVSGKAYYDTYGRVTEQYHPTFETKDNTTKFVLNEEEVTITPFTTKYDEIDRPVTTIDSDGNISDITYALSDASGTMAIQTTTIVQNEGLEIKTENYKDTNGKVIATNNIGGSDGSIWTRFNYNAIGELLSYQDADGFTTTYTYDALGRKTSVTHPDNGLTSFKYDPANNLVQLQTNNLRNDATLDPSNRFINYTYDYNRVTNINYPETPSGTNISNVTYKYGEQTTDPESINDIGRLIFQADATGTQEFKYGTMGEMVQTVRTIIAPNIPERTFKTSFRYDSWNRLMEMQYPDLEKVSFSYDLGGNLTQMTGEVNNLPYDYIKRIDYDHYEQRSYLLYGNNTETFYTYSDNLRRLQNLNVKTAQNEDLFNNDYQYDPVGNVTQLSNSATYTANHMGGDYSHTFTYDNLNRLATATGTFNGAVEQQALNNDFQSDYDLEMVYSNTHSILNKKQNHNKNNDAYLPNTYENEYKYIPNTHKLAQTTDLQTSLLTQFNYDGNGNLTKKYATDGNESRLLWDESNRLRIVSDEHTMNNYFYDAAGERVLKANSDIEAVYENGTLVTPSQITINSYTTYPNAYIVIDPHGLYSKHYYAGSQRIVSRIGEKSISIFDSGTIPRQAATTAATTDYKKLQQLQISNVQHLLEKQKLGKAMFKPYATYTYEQIQKTIAEELDNPSQNRAPGPGESAVGLVYFYHPDHLGTSTFLTDINGRAYQFFLNLPFGETMAEQLPSEYYKTPYKFNGKELDEETGLYYYGARYYDPKVSNWLSVDPLAEKYPAYSPYCYVMNNPINAIDPDGRRVYFVGGAGNDSDGWNYIGRFKAFLGLKDFRRVNASHGKAGDIEFVNRYRNNEAYGNNGANRSASFVTHNPSEDKQYKRALKGIMNDLKKNPLKEGEQFNLTGYSYGAVLQEHLAIGLADKGIKVDNLILVGSPTSDGSDLMNKLNEYKEAGKIGNIIREDIKGDHLSNPSNEAEFVIGGIQNLRNSGAHFDLARPGAEADNKIKQLGEKLKKNGVE